MELPPTGPQTVALDFHVWPWILSSFVWELLDFDVLPRSIDFGVEEGHNLASEFLPEGLFEGLTQSSIQGEAAPQGSAIWTLPVKENLFVILENIL